MLSLDASAAHYSIYFKSSGNSNAADRQIQFDLSELRPVYKSFLDSTVVELCLPGSVFTTQALFACLKAIGEESARELKRCPQAMWDAVGDLAVRPLCKLCVLEVIFFIFQEAVRLLDLLETPLLTPEGVVWKRAVPIPPMEFKQWEDAQTPSINATQRVNEFKDLAFPLSRLRNKVDLPKIWARINSVSARICHCVLCSLRYLELHRGDRT